MDWHVANPPDAGGLERDAGIQAAGDGPVDYRLLALRQQFDETLLAGDVPLDAVVHVVEVAHDGGLLGEGREGQLMITYVPNADSIIR